MNRRMDGMVFNQEILILMVYRTRFQQHGHTDPLHDDLVGDVLEDIC